MAVLLIAEHDNAHVKDATHKALTAALQMAGDCPCSGRRRNNAAGAAGEAAKLQGVVKVLPLRRSAVRAPARRADRRTHRVARGQLRHLVAPATTNGKNYMPRVAALLDVMQVSDISEVKSPDTFVRLIYAGNAVQTVQSSDAKKVHHRSHRRFPADGRWRFGTVETVAATADPGLSSYQSENLSKSGRPELTSARIIVSGRPRHAER